MPIIRLKGKVLPRATLISTGAIRTIKWTESTGATPVFYTVTIIDSAITVDCQVESFDVDDNHVILIYRALWFSRAIVESIGFVQGRGYIVVIDELIDTDGTVRPLDLRYPRLSDFSTAFTESSPLDEMLLIVLSDPHLFLCLNELIAAISGPDQIANCARVIEGLRNILVPYNPRNSSGAWTVMRETLNLDRSYIDLITETSFGPRHGNREGIPYSVTDEVIRRSWTIMDRFLHYRKRGNSPLPEEEFPILQ